MKKSLLINWTSRTFIEVFQPIIPKLAENFKIVILLLEYSTPEGMAELLNSWKKQGVIEECLITPNHRKMLKIHLFIAAAIKKLKAYKFDFWLTDSEVWVPERYIQECVLPESCIRVAFWHNITYLLMYNEGLARSLLKETQAGRMLFPEPDRQLGDKFRKLSLAERIKETKTFPDLSRKAIRYIRRLSRLPLKKSRLYWERFILPLVLTGKTFRLGPYDKLTQVSSGRCDAIIFTDEIETQAHRALLKTSNVYTAQYPTQGSCRCNGRKEGRAAILSPLSGFVGRSEIPQEALNLFYRDFKAVLLKTNAENIHLRVHPDETGTWYIQLRDYLIKNGVNSRIVDCKLPIREVMCDYIGMAGYASAALRDGRACCDYAFVIAFAGISRFQFSNPKIVFGASEGISWINEDGSYDEAIFNKEKYIPPERKSISVMLKELPERCEAG